MKIFELIRMASGNLKARWVILPAIGIAISAFCLCYAGVVLTTVGDEKALPYELVLSAEGAKSLSDKTLADIAKLPGVEAVTPLLQVSARVKTGVYSAQLMLTGMDPAYLQEGFTAGGVFPDNGVMPYIVLNNSACKQFSDENIETEPGSDTGAGTNNNAKTSTGTATGINTGTNTTAGNSNEATADAPKINWLNTGFSIQSGEGRWIVSRVCGILAGDDKQEPVAFVSLSAAKDLLQKSGQSTDFTGANIRITNIGFAGSISQSITALGVNVTNSNAELQAKWDSELKEMAYLIVTGVFSLLCTTVLMAAQRKISRLEQKETWTMLQWIGMKKIDIGRLFLIQAMIISLIGIAIGIIVSISLPSFLPPELKETSIYTLQIPFEIAALSIAVCIAPVVLSFLNIKNRIDSD